MPAPQRYDHPTFTTRQFQNLLRSIAGTTSVHIGRLAIDLLLKSITSLPVVIGTSDTGVHVIRRVTSTTTTVLGTITTGTDALTGGVSPAAMAIGTANSPVGESCLAGDQITFTNAVDGTVVYDAIMEFELLASSTLRG